MVRELILLHEVLSANLGGIHPDCIRQKIDDPLHLEIELLASVAAVGAGRALVGMNDEGIPGQVLDVVGTKLVARRSVRAGRLGTPKVSPHVVHGLLANGENGSVLLSRSLDVRHPVGPAGAGHQMFHAVFDVLDRNPVFLAARAVITI